MLGGVTQEGLNLIAQSQASGNKLRFTHYALGSDMPTPLEDYTTFTSLGESKLELPILRANHLGGNKVLVVGNLEIGTLKDSFVYHELGVYAQIGDEPPKLHSYFWKVDGENMTPELLVERTLAVEVFVDRTTEVHLDINHSIEWLTRLEFLEHTETKTGNPHGVTKHDVELGKVINRGQYTIGQYELGEYTDDYLNALVGLHMMESKIKEHLGENNPHKITKQTVDLGLVQNYPVVDETTLETLSSEAYMTPFHTNLLYLNLLKKGQYLLQHFTDYNKLLTKEGLTGGPNIQVIDTPEGRKVTYTGSVEVGNPRWEDIQETNTFHTHPDVVRTLKEFVTTLTSENKTIRITKVNGGYNLESTLSLNFEDIGGNPTDNLKLQGALSKLIEKVNLVSSDTVEKVVEGDTISFKVKPQILLSTPEFTKVLASKLTLTLEELDSKINSAVKVKEIRSANSNCVVTTGADGVVTIDVKTQTGSGGSGGGDSGGSGSVDLSNYYTKQEVDQRLESKLGLLEDYPQLATQNKTVIGAVAELDSRLDSAASLIVNQDKEIDDLKKYSVDYKNQTVKAINSKANSSLTIESTTKEVVGVINALELGSGFVPHEFGESTFPMMYQVGTSTLNYQMGGNVAVASSANHLLIWRRSKEFNWRFTKKSFDTNISVIRVSPHGKYICVGRTDVWQVFNSETLEQEYELRTFNTAIPCFTYDEVHFCYFSDTQSLQCYNMQTKVIDKLIKSTAYRLEFMKNDLSGYVTNYYFSVTSDNTSKQSYESPSPKYFIDNRMFAIQGTDLVECTYEGTTLSTEVKVEMVNTVKTSQSHIFCYYSSSPKTYRVFDTPFNQVGETYAGTEMPQYVFGEYGIKMNGATPKLFYPDKEINPYMAVNHNYAYDLTSIYYKDQNGNKIVKFRRDGADFVFDSYLPATPPVSDVKCSPNGKVVMVYGNINELFENGVKVDRPITRGNYIPLDNKDYYINGQNLWKWNGSAYAQSTNLRGNTFDRQLKYALPSSGNSVYLILGEQVEELPLGMQVNYGSLGIDTVYSGTQGYYARLDYENKQAYPMYIPGNSKISRCGEGILLPLVGYSYGDMLGAIASCNPLFNYTEVCGQTLFGSGTVTTLLALS